MDNLTQKWPDGTIVFADIGSLPCRECYGKSETECDECPVAKLLNRLFAYESTGLKPSEIIMQRAFLETYKCYCRGKSPEEIESDFTDLAAYSSIGTIEGFQRLATAKNEGRLVELPCKVGDKLYQGYSEGIDDAKINEIVIEIRTDMGVFEPSDIGKTVFLTREQAEKKLAEGEA